MSLSLLEITFRDKSGEDGFEARRGVRHSATIPRSLLSSHWRRAGSRESHRRAIRKIADARADGCQVQKHLFPQDEGQ